MLSNLYEGGCTLPEYIILIHFSDGRFAVIGDCVTMNYLAPGAGRGGVTPIQYGGPGPRGVQGAPERKEEKEGKEKKKKKE